MQDRQLAAAVTQFPFLKAEFMELEGAHEDDVARARYVAYESARTGRTVEPPEDLDDLPFTYLPPSRQDAAVAAT